MNGPFIGTTIPVVIGFPSAYKHVASPRTRKADVAEHPGGLDHVGLLFNKPPSIAELLFI